MRIPIAVIVIVLIMAAFVSSAHAYDVEEERPYNLVCFDKQGLTSILNQVVNTQQFLRNDFGQFNSRDVRRIMSKGGCDFVQIPSGSQSRRAGIHETENGFIFPLFAIRYSTTGQRMYAADAIFLSKHWSLSMHCGQRHNFSGDQLCIVPKTCEILDGFINLSRRPLPDYIVVPKSCRSYTVM